MWQTERTSSIKERDKATVEAELTKRRSEEIKEINVNSEKDEDAGSDR